MARLVFRKNEPIHEDVNRGKARGAWDEGLQRVLAERASKRAGLAAFSKEVGEHLQANAGLSFRGTDRWVGVGAVVQGASGGDALAAAHLVFRKNEPIHEDANRSTARGAWDKRQSSVLERASKRAGLAAFSMHISEMGATVRRESLSTKLERVAFRRNAG